MKTFYLVGNDDGIRFIPSVGLHFVIPCEIYGEMLIDDDFEFSAAQLRSINQLICNHKDNE